MAHKQFSGVEKMGILREHLVEGVPISEVCRKHGLQPTVFYHWQKRLSSMRLGTSFQNP